MIQPNTGVASFKYGLGFSLQKNISYGPDICLVHVEVEICYQSWYEKEKTTAWPLLFSIELVTKFGNRFHHVLHGLGPKLFGQEKKLALPT